MTKEVRIYIEKEIVSSVSGPVKMGQLHVKE